MESLENFKRDNPESWRYFGPGGKVSTVLYFLDKDEIGLSKKELSEKTELSNSELEKGLSAMQQTNEIFFRENAVERRYYLEDKAREEFKGLYNF